MSQEKTNHPALGDILIVEDIRSDLKLLSEILTDAGYRVRPASDGELALRSVQAGMPDLILLDIRLPGMDGVEVCRRLKSDPDTRDIPVIFLSSLGETELKVKALDAGGVDYVTKPFESSEVLARISTHLKLFRLQQEMVAQSKKLRREIRERKLAEEGLKSSEKSSRAWLENSPVCTKILDLDFNLLYVSSAGVKQLNIDDITQFYGTQYPFQFYPDSFRSRMTADLKKARETGELITLEAPVVDFDGNTLWFHSTIVPVKDDDGQVEYLIVVSVDTTKRNESDAELKKWGLVFRHAGWGVAIADAHTHELLTVNPTFAEMHGYSMEEVQKVNLADVFLEEDRELLQARADTVHETGNLIYESTHRRKDGTRFPVAVDVTAIYDDDGDVVYRAANIQDITERKATEEALQLTQFSVDNLTDAVYWMGSDAEFVYVNNAATEALGYSEEELLTMTVHDIDPEFPLKAWTPHWADLKNKKSLVIQSHHRREDGSTFPVEITLNHIRFGERELNCAIARDISERHRKEKTRRESEALLLAMAENYPNSFISIIEEDYTVGFSSGQEFKNQNLDPEQFIGLSLEQIFGEQTAIVREYYEKTFNGQECTFELSSNGQYQLYRTVPLRSDDDVIHRILVVVENITERVRSEEEKLSLERQVQHAQKLESLGILAGGIAHDFNNLLMTVLGNADIALQDLARHSPARTSIETIVETAHKAAGLSKQMLAYSGRGSFVIESISLNMFVQEMTHLLDVSISKNAILKYNFAENLPGIHGDATQIRQIVMNLIINASEAIGDRSGVISLSTGAMECDREYLSAPGNTSLAGLKESPQEGLYVYLEVADTGCGMDKETQEKLFDPFFTTKFTGRGLGMAATLGIVRGHHGMIKVYSEVGQGTTIKVLFPVTEQEDVEESGEAKVDRTADWRGEGMILVADDEETVCAVTGQYLERLGFEVITASDGREAIDLFREHSKEIVCVLLDMTMPHVDGKEAFRGIRKIRKDARVILCSGYNEQDATQPFAGKGLAGFLQKPYRSDELREKLMKVLS